VGYLDHHLQCPINTSGDVQTAEDGLKNQALKLGKTKISSPSESPHRKQASKQPRNPSSSCCCSLLFRIDDLKHFDARCSASKPFGQLQNRRSDLLRLRITFLILFTAALLRNFNKMVERELLIVVLQELEDMFSITPMNLRS
jgi:hypothetical protein